MKNWLRNSDITISSIDEYPAGDRKKIIPIGVEEARNQRIKRYTNILLTDLIIEVFVNKELAYERREYDKMKESYKEKMPFSIYCSTTICGNNIKENICSFDYFYDQLCETSLINPEPKKASKEFFNHGIHDIYNSVLKDYL